jgi:Amt family ammonium transporter
MAPEPLGGGINVTNGIDMEARIRALEVALAALQVNGGTSKIAPVGPVWELQSSSHIFFMQAGFALVEAGTCRSKNVLSILIKNLVDFLVAVVLWYSVGFGLAFGNAAPTSGLCGTTRFFGSGLLHGTSVSDELSTWHMQGMFCATASTIVSGGIAERTDMRGYLLFSGFMSGVIFPTVACWCWNPHGWLRGNGFQDLAGSGVVHLTGGFGALCGAWLLGPRAGRFGADGKVAGSADFAPHSVPFIVLGTMILWYGWYAFNSGSVGSLGTEEDFKRALLAAVNTTISGAAGGLTAHLLTFLNASRWDLPYICNGVLSGLVAICAGCDSVQPISAFAIGAVASVLFSGACSAQKMLRIDDPVSAFGVHGVGGLWGVIAISLFSMEGTVVGEPAKAPPLLGQLLGALVISAFSAFACTAVFLFLRHLGILKSSALQQQRGLDHESANRAYNTSGQVERYSAMVCHVKNSHGASARWMQLELGKYAGGKSSIFLDSDNLINLNHLLSTVRDKVDVLVVLATKDIWWRPWCAGEITTASSSGIPIVLAMMADGDKPLELDFDDISRQVPSKLTHLQMEVLAPFGISHEDIQRAYAKLEDAPQVGLSVQNPMVIRETIDSLSRLAELNGMRERTILTRLGSELVSAVADMPQMTAIDCVKKCLRRSRTSFLLLGNPDDVEAVAAMRILEFAILEVSEARQEYVDIYNSSMCPEAVVLRCVDQGIPIIFVLSKDVLNCTLVQRVCVLRASRLWPQGIGGALAVFAETMLLIHADRLDFEYPDAAGYEDIHKTCLDKLKQTGRNSSITTTITSGTLGKYNWDSVELAFGCNQDRALALVNFYRWLFNQLALALSTHGSWRTILHQVECIYERTSRMSMVSNHATVDSAESSVALSETLRAVTPSPTARSRMDSYFARCSSNMSFDLSSQHVDLEQDLSNLAVPVYDAEPHPVHTGQKAQCRLTLKGQNALLQKP